jgi:hypothetical protein
MKNVLSLALLLLTIIAVPLSATIVYPPVKYGKEVTVYFGLYDSNSTWRNYATAPAAADVHVFQDGASEARAANAVTDLGRTFSLVLTAAEMQAKIVVVDINDASDPPLYCDEQIIIPTYGHASALNQLDLDLATVDAKLTAANDNVVVDVNQVDVMSATARTNFEKWFATNWATVFDDTNDVPNSRLVAVSNAAGIVEATGAGTSLNLDASGNVTLANAAQGGAATVLTLDSIVISNADGPALSLTGTTGGILATASAGPGASFSGTTYGLYGVASAGPGAGFVGTTYGLYASASAGPGIYGVSTGSNGAGIQGVAHGTGVDLAADNIATTAAIFSEDLQTEAATPYTLAWFLNNINGKR